MNDILFVVSAFVLGALHALEPGHGKTVVAAYLIGSKGRVRDAIALGGVVTFTHTFSIIILGVITAVAAAYLVPETVHEVMEIFSGLLVLGVGLWMVNGRILKGRTAHGHSPAAGHSHPSAAGGAHHDHPHGAAPTVAPVLAGAAVAHAHGVLTHTHPLPRNGMHYHQGKQILTYAPDHEPSHEHAHSSDHDHPHSPVDAHEHPHSHEDPHDHPHRPEGPRDHDRERLPQHEHSALHPHDHDHEHPPEHEPSAGHAHEHDDHHPHAHDGHDHGHSHLPPAGERMNLVGLVGLGISGGIVPCPAALALLLAATATGNILGGISLVVVFSLGLATVLIAIGITLVKAADVVARRLGGRLDGDGKLARGASMASAVVVTLLGLAMTAHAVLHVAGVELPI